MGYGPGTTSYCLTCHEWFTREAPALGVRCLDCMADAYKAAGARKAAGPRSGPKPRRQSAQERPLEPTNAQSSTE